MRTASEMMNSFAVLTTLKLARIHPFCNKISVEKENDGGKREPPAANKRTFTIVKSKEGTPWFQLLPPFIQCIQGDHLSPMY
jgi:hypothetical protein